MFSQLIYPLKDKQGLISASIPTSFIAFRTLLASVSFCVSEKSSLYLLFSIIKDGEILSFLLLLPLLMPLFDF